MGRYPSITDRNLTKGFNEVLDHVNDISYSWASNMVLIGIYIITIFGVYFYKNDLSQAAAIAGFLTAIVATFFWIAGFVSVTTLIMVIVIAIAGVASLWID